jgi:hypothetical protein
MENIILAVVEKVMEANPLGKRGTDFLSKAASNLNKHYEMVGENAKIVDKLYT